MDASPFKRLERTSFRSKISQALTEAILSGQLKPGTQLVETELAEEFGVSRAPVREALLELASASLVEIVPRKGTFVAAADYDHAREVYSLRKTVEAFAFEQAVTYATEPELDELERCMADLREAVARRDRNLLVEADLKHHRGLVKLAHHRLLYQTWLSMEVHVRRYLAIGYGLPQDMQEFVTSHQATVDALRRRDLPAGTDTVRKHVERSWQRVAARLESREGRPTYVTS